MDSSLIAHAQQTNAHVTGAEIDCMHVLAITPFDAVCSLAAPEGAW